MSKCANCGTSGNVCLDSDGVERCTECSYVNWRERWRRLNARTCAIANAGTRAFKSQGS